MFSSMILSISTVSKVLVRGSGVNTEWYGSRVHTEYGRFIDIGTGGRIIYIGTVISWIRTIIDRVVWRIEWIGYPMRRVMRIGIIGSTSIIFIMDWIIIKESIRWIVIQSMYVAIDPQQAAIFPKSLFSIVGILVISVLTIVRVTSWII
jgi:hypothetical protein